MFRSAIIRPVVAFAAAMSAAAALLACNLQAASGRAVNQAILMNLQQSSHFKLPAATIITAAAVLSAPINVLNEVSGHANAGAGIKTCATFEECERDFAQLRAEIKSLSAENKALKDNIAFGHTGVNAAAAATTGALMSANNTKGRRLADVDWEGAAAAAKQEAKEFEGALRSCNEGKALLNTCCKLNEGRRLQALQEWLPGQREEQDCMKMCSCKESKHGFLNLETTIHLLCDGDS